MEKAKNEIMNEFNFSKVKSVMDLLDWKYYNTKTEKITIEELISTASSLLDDVISGKTTYCSTGGFTARKEEDSFMLSFDIEEVQIPKEETSDFVRDIMSEFDFDKVQKVMHFLDWTYFSTINDKVTMEEIKNTAFIVLSKIKEKNLTSCSTGGFSGYFESNFYSLAFEVEISESFFFEEV